MVPFCSMQKGIYFSDKLYYGKIAIRYKIGDITIQMLIPVPILDSKEGEKVMISIKECKENLFLQSGKRNSC